MTPADEHLNTVLRQTSDNMPANANRGDSAMNWIEMVSALMLVYIDHPEYWRTNGVVMLEGTRRIVWW